MPYFKDTENKLHWLDDAAFAYMLPPGCVEITDFEADALRTAVLPPAIPEVVTMRQARLALLQSGLLAQVNTAIANMSGIDGDAARIEWEFSNTVERNQPLVQSLIGALGLTEAQLDDLFTLAATL